MLERPWNRCDDTLELCQAEGMPAPCPPQDEEAECSTRNLEISLGRLSSEPPEPVELESCLSVYDEPVPF